MTAEAIVAPTDAQLGYIRDLCDRNGFPRPECVHSSREASIKPAKVPKRLRRLLDAD